MAANEAQARVLLVDDEPDLRTLVTFNLRGAGFEVEAAANAQEGLAAMKRFRPDVVVLDLMLPDLPGAEVCRRIRSDPEQGHIGILMLTARADEYDRVLGFEIGADDYVVKPFSVRELVHRVRALSRRAGTMSAGSPAKGSQLPCWHGIQMDTVHHRVTIDGAETELRPLEFRLLELFLMRREEVLSRSQLLAEAWGITAAVNTRTVDTHVRRLREALGRYGDAIETVRGFGYRLRRE
jgi:two-component system, OmpR family, phosphate regulon response regulator PhoB